MNDIHIISTKLCGTMLIAASSAIQFHFYCIASWYRMKVIIGMKICVKQDVNKDSIEEIKKEFDGMRSFI